MIRLIQVFIRKTKDLWNIYGGIALSTLIAFLTHWDKIEMDRWASYLILTLTCISVLTFFKLVYSKKKKANALDKGAIHSQRSINTLKNAVDPMATGQEVGEAIIYTYKGGKKVMKKVKNFFKEIWGNKFTLGNTIIVLIFATLSQIMTYTEYLYRINWFAEHEIVIKIASPIVAIVWVFIDLLTTYTKYGFESLDEIANRKLAKKTSELSKEEIQHLKGLLKQYKASLVTLRKRKMELEKMLQNFTDLDTAHYVFNTKEMNEWDELKKQYNVLSETIDNTIKNIEDIESKL